MLLPRTGVGVHPLSVTSQRPLSEGAGWDDGATWCFQASGPTFPFLINGEQREHGSRLAGFPGTPKRHLPGQRVCTPTGPRGGAVGLKSTRGARRPAPTRRCPRRPERSISSALSAHGAGRGRGAVSGSAKSNVMRPRGSGKPKRSTGLGSSPGTPGALGCPVLSGGPPGCRPRDEGRKRPGQWAVGEAGTRAGLSRAGKGTYGGPKWVF